MAKSPLLARLVLEQKGRVSTYEECLPSATACEKVNDDSIRKEEELVEEIEKKIDYGNKKGYELIIFDYNIYCSSSEHAGAVEEEEESEKSII